MKRKLDISSWPRKEHFYFFRQFEEPFFGVCVNVDCTLAYDYCKGSGTSFFLFYLHKSLIAANETENFRYRIENDEIVIYDQVNASPTIDRKDGTFGFGYMDYHPSFREFEKIARDEIQRVQQSSGLMPSASGDNVIHYSAIPWINFTSLTHARAFSFKDSVPKISFGKVHDEGGRKMMPTSVHVHHGLMDGLHVSQFIDRYQRLMETP